MRARLPGSFDALREREFRLLFSAHAISVFGDWLVPVAIAFAVLDLTGSASDLGFVIAARLVPMVVFMLAGGVLADRVPRQLLMIASSLVALVSEATLGVLLVMGTARIWEIVVLQAVRGTTAAFFRPASTGIVPDIVSPQRLQQANALMWGAFGIAGFAGPAVAGVFLATVGGGWAILGDAATFGVAAWLLSRMRLPVREVSRRQSFLRKLARRRGRSSPRPSGSGPSSATSPRSISTPERPLVVAYLLCMASTPSLVLLGFAAPAPAIAAAELVAGLCIGVSGVLYETTLQQQVPREAFGRVASWDWMGSTALRPIGLAVAGPLAAAVGTRAVLVGGAAVTVASLLCLVAVPEVRSMRAGGTGAEAVVTPFVGEEPLPEDQALEM